jgi:hypothetical protein
VHGLLRDDHSSALRKTGVYASESVIGSLDFNEEDGFLESWLGGQLTCIEAAS